MEHSTAQTVERAPELARLRAAFAAAAAGRGGTLVLEAPAGAGKTHLVDAAAGLAHEAGVRALRADGSPLGGAISFGVALELLDPLLGPRMAAGELPTSVRRILDSDRAAGPEPEDGAAALACVGLARLCERTASDSPLALLVDDIHWADPASLHALAAIARRAGRAGIALVVALRLGEEPTDADALAALRGESPAEIVRLAPLSAVGVGELLALCGAGEVDDDAVAECAHLTGGNPLLVTQVAALARDRAGPVTVAALERLRVDGAVSVAATVEARLRRLGADAERIVAACAVLGDDATAGRATALAQLDEAGAVAALDRLAAVGILEPDEPLRFAHPLVRDAVHGARPAAARASDHARAAELLAAEGADPERTASQLLHARPTASPEAVARLTAAAEQALSRGVPSAAASYLERALAEPPAPDERARLLLELGLAEALLGRPDAAEQLHAARAAASTPELRAEADLRLGRHLYAGGSYAEAERAFERGLAECDGGDERLVAQLRACSLAAARYAGTFAGRGDERLAAVLERPASGETPAERALLAELAIELGVRGESRDRVVALALRAWADGALAATSDRDGIAVSQVAAALVWSDAYEEAHAVLAYAIEHAEAVGSPTGVATARYMRSWARLYRGDLAGAVDDVTAALGTEGWDMYRPSAQSLLAHAHIGRAELDAAARALELPGGDEGWRDSVPFALTLEARGRLAALRGDDEAAVRDLLACGERLSPMGPHNPSSRWRVWAALCLHRRGDRAEAERLVEAELDAARGAGAARPLGTALVAHGVVAGGEPGVAHLREAVDVLAPSGARPDHAWALCRLGEQLRRLDRSPAAREPLRAALALADELGATLIAERAASELSAAGGRPRRRALHGADALTPAERRAARLAATGRTNRAIALELVVTEKTVQFHLTNAYRKLGVRSRAELGTALEPSPDGLDAGG